MGIKYPLFRKKRYSQKYIKALIGGQIFPGTWNIQLMNAKGIRIPYYQVLKLTTMELSYGTRRHVIGENQSSSTSRTPWNLAILPSTKNWGCHVKSYPSTSYKKEN